ncbi:MAG: TetR/AcrR family transcriptional regulator [Acidimicrobiia bacterium]|nr:TetR/AcrR family transcriptional regulator [Acidimicrobiia bacterium]MDH4363275.1 TetR/AcrR family transcriptional regulator [Acidimicrobiia bacterium]
MSPTRTPSSGTPADAPRRRYRSPLRAQRAEETRSAILATATGLFMARGWANTGMRDVAREAGVAVETLYSHYPSKRKLFDAVVDRSVTGDDQPLAVAQRPEFHAMGRGKRGERLAAAAAILAAIHGRTAPFAKLIRQAAAADGEVAELLRATRERQRADVGAGLALILGRPPAGDELDGVWAFASPEVYLLLVEESGWSPERYQRWMAETLGRILPRT